MTKHKTIGSTTACTNIQSFNRSVCLETRIDCTPTKDPLLNDCENTYCATRNRIAEKPYFVPYIVGVKIQFEFKLDDNYNSDPMNPEFGWGSFMTGIYYNHDGSIISADWSKYASRKMVAWSGLESYQIIEIDTQLLANDGYYCFSFKAQSRTSDEGNAVVQVSCTEEFGSVGCDDGSVTIEGIYNKYDCFGNYYGVPVSYVGDKMQYSNKLTLPGWLRNSNYEVSVDYNDSFAADKVTNQPIWLLVVNQVFPAFMKDEIFGKLLGSGEFLIDGVEYLADKRSPIIVGWMFKCEQEVYLKCVTGLNNCN